MIPETTTPPLIVELVRSPPPRKAAVFAFTVESVSESVPLKFQMPPPQADGCTPGSSANPQPAPGEPGTCVAVFWVTLELTRLTVAKFMSMPPELPALLPVTAERISSRSTPAPSSPAASMPPPKDPGPAVFARTVVSTSAAEAPASMMIPPPSPSVLPLVITRLRIVAFPAVMSSTRPLWLPSSVGGPGNGLFTTPLSVMSRSTDVLPTQVPLISSVSPALAASTASWSTP